MSEARAPDETSPTAHSDCPGPVERFGVERAGEGRGGWTPRIWGDATRRELRRGATGGSTMDGGGGGGGLEESDRRELARGNVEGRTA